MRSRRRLALVYADVAQADCLNGLVENGELTEEAVTAGWVGLVDGLAAPGRPGSHGDHEFLLAKRSPAKALATAQLRVDPIDAASVGDVPLSGGVPRHGAGQWF